MLPYILYILYNVDIVLKKSEEPKMSAIVQCPQHPGSNLIEDYRAGDMICSECGLVVGDRVVDVGSEWRTFSNEKGGEDRSRVGGPENALLGGSDLSTMIGPARGAASLDSSGNSIYQNRRSISSSDRTLMNAFRTISTMCDRINLAKSISDRANRYDTYSVSYSISMKMTHRVIN